ncbi:MAG: YegS/Rv2252/BmrU family lipid kinase [Clostridia bacterium]|nr:YegS/Rv2252/BmrU family lipid kinase [Clostridia bacterium]
MLSEKNFAFDEYDSPADGERVLFVVNPYAGKGISVAKAERLINILRSTGWKITLYLTKARHDATCYVSEHGGRFDKIICLGGDGTLNEVITGLIASGHNIPIGYIPAGSANDLGSSIGMPKNNFKAAKKILSGEIHTHDVGLFNGVNFVYIASFGAFTEVSWATPQSVKKVFGHSAYVFNGAKALFNIHPYSVRVTTDNEEFEGRYIYCGASNTFRVGGMYRFSETEANLSDGLMEIMLVKEPAPAEVGTLLNKLLRHDFDSKYINFIHSRTAVVEPLDGNYPIWTLDGEKKICNGIANLSCMHKRVRLVY